MDINRLHYFYTVSQTGSLTKASELLGISQPALSKAIKLLEHEVGQSLLIPSGRGVAISDYGQKLSLQIAPILEQIEGLKFLDQVEEQQQPISIASFEVFSTYFLGKVIDESFQDRRLRVLELTPGPMEKAIANYEADIGITYLPIPHPDLDILKVATIKMNIYGLQTKFKKTKFEDLNFVTPNTPVSGTPSKAKGLDGWPDHLIPRKIMYEVAMMETALDLCRRGLCAGYFPKFVVDLHNSTVSADYQLKPIANPPKLKSTDQDVYMIKRKSDLESSNFKKISRLLRLIK